MVSTLFTALALIAAGQAGTADRGIGSVDRARDGRMVAEMRRERPARSVRARRDRG